MARYYNTPPAGITQTLNTHTRLLVRPPELPNSVVRHERQEPNAAARRLGVSLTEYVARADSHFAMLRANAVPVVPYDRYIPSNNRTPHYGNGGRHAQSSHAGAVITVADFAEGQPLSNKDAMRVPRALARTVTQGLAAYEQWARQDGVVLFDVFCPRQYVYQPADSEQSPASYQGTHRPNQDPAIRSMANAERLGSLTLVDVDCGWLRPTNPSTPDIRVQQGLAAWQRAAGLHL